MFGSSESITTFMSSLFSTTSTEMAIASAIGMCSSDVSCVPALLRAAAPSHCVAEGSLPGELAAMSPGTRAQQESREQGEGSTR